MKILSDFDGVWTDPTHEADAVALGLAEDLAALTGFELERVRHDLAHCRRQALSEPERHGWELDGRVTAYCDEDAFLAVSGIASWLTEARDPLCAPYVEAVSRSDAPSFMQLADAAFKRLGARPGVGALLPSAVDVLTRLEELGVDLVLVSNSDTEKLVRLFDDVGVSAATDDSARVRVRGAAMKWRLGDAPRRLEFDGRSVDVDRPWYRAIIEEERPDLVVGDVFSLDLALPHHMRAGGEDAAPSTLVHRPPAAPTRWVADHLSSGRIDAVAPTLPDLARIVEKELART